jgi:hypothetical protein
LEGPKDVAVVAQKLLEATAFLLNAAGDRIRAAEVNREPKHRLWADAARETSEALEQFLIKASTLMDL